MASRFAQRDSRSSLFSAYESRDGTKSESPYRDAGDYHRQFDPTVPSAHPAFHAYPGSAGVSSNDTYASQYRAATPNKRGQYSDAVLSELESQNDDQLEGMSAKVRMLKDVRVKSVSFTIDKITSAIGEEIRDSTALTERMNESFESTRVRIRGTMNRMLRMAERTGVGWKVWLVFFSIVILMFWYVWVFI